MPVDTLVDQIGEERHRGAESHRAESGDHGGAGPRDSGARHEQQLVTIQMLSCCLVGSAPTTVHMYASAESIGVPVEGYRDGRYSILTPFWLSTLFGFVAFHCDGHRMSENFIRTARGARQGIMAPTLVSL